MKKSLKEQYTRLVAFLGAVLGPDYEIALHDLSKKDVSVVAIVNAQVTGRKIGSPITSKSLEFLAKKRYLTKDYEANYNGYSMEGKRLRTSTFYIKDEGELVGLLCVNFDDSKFENLSQQILRLCHPDELVARNSFETAESLKSQEETEMLGRDIHEVAEYTVNKVLARRHTSVERLTKQEKMDVVAELARKGVFELKGAVGEVAEKLQCSPATLYRYMSVCCNKSE